jgi:thiol-disulfide isomerase/thioredoxin
MLLQAIVGTFAVLAVLSGHVVAQQRANVGEKVPDVAFPAFVNGDGRQKLSDFFGQPVVIDMWGTNCGPCIGVAVPAAIKHDLEHKAEGLVTILVESQGADAAKHEAFLWKTFPTNQCFSCTGVGVPVPESRGIPYCAIVGVDGTLLWVGNPAATPKPVEEFVAAELVKVKKGWGETPEHRKVRAQLYGKNDLAGAAALVAAMADGEAKTQLQAEIDARYKIAKESVAALQQQGDALAAQARAKDLLKAVGARAEWVAEVQPLVAAFDAPEAKAELALDRKLDKVVKQLRDKKGDAAPKALQALLKDAGSSKVGERAQRLLTALQSQP